ncbi:MAG: copper transporter [Bacillota bacterium]|uniref:Copper transport outer membrane protein, MctB n=2 Tax=Carboxydocella TaxID=178898 RepID=A0A1T4NIW7_9FIRM|nr:MULTISPECIES: copper transporter [Carboxydocella]AVX20057.1 Copper transport outer membrane protein, MctB [Carboxydocella thermautotrophica]AVX30474.1 Copper transport outer membrane protein, MctB [Carboxydocella thermautotrophica]GAW27867.1 hypothetical protein ULO1_04370 [Carboxydocella sp. ULO1]SJZ78987.1 Copper transport outer membrane protein, MctB [Carboxydocella sporoproducens DSM 16521]
MFDLRYHIVSLVAVFLALGIGILIGSAMETDNTLIQQQKVLTDRLAADLEKLRGENKEAMEKLAKEQKESAQQEEFVKEVLPVLIKNRLTGYRVAIIDTGDYGFNDDLLDILKKAGAVVTSTSVLSRDFVLADPQLQKEVAAFLGVDPNSQAAIVKEMTWQVTRGLVVGDNLAVIKFLTDKKLLKITGAYGQPLQGVIIIGGSQQPQTAQFRVENIDLPLIEALQQKGIEIFGTEYSRVAVSYMKNYQRYKISTIDNIDTPMGQVALVAAMEGRPGDYGIKATAGRLLPDLNREVKRIVLPGSVPGAGVSTSPQ